MMLFNQRRLIINMFSCRCSILSNATVKCDTGVYQSLQAWKDHKLHIDHEVTSFSRFCKATQQYEVASLGCCDHKLYARWTWSPFKWIKGAFFLMACRGRVLLRIWSVTCGNTLLMVVVSFLKSIFSNVFILKILDLLESKTGQRKAHFKPALLCDWQVTITASRWDPSLARDFWVQQTKLPTTKTLWSGLHNFSNYEEVFKQP